MSSGLESLSGEQREAVTSKHRNLVVAAAAGSGKTRVLVERYLKHIQEDHVRADQILTITFTKKAAAEMKRRIVDRLNDCGLPDQAQIAETGPIQTIHGFCERLLKENALDAGLDPEFEILSEPQTDRMIEEAIREVIASPMEDDEAGALLSRLAGKRSYGESFSPHAKLEEAIRKALKDLRGTGVSLEDLEDSYRSPFALLIRWRELLLASLPEDVREAAHASSADNLAMKLQDAYRQLKKAKPRYIRPTVSEDTRAAEDACGLMQIVCASWRKLDREMRRAQAIDFTALETLAVGLLQRSEAVRDRVRGQYPVALIDEAQDMNPMQYKLLDAISPETVMIVGDRQQSIYGFRQAAVELFQEKSVTWNSTKLTRNYRSSQGVLGAVDLVFSAKWEAYEPMAEGREPLQGIEFWVQRQRDTDLTAELVRALVEERRAEGGSAREVAVLVRSSRYGIELLRRLEQRDVPARLSGGSEQFYARIEVRDLANALEAVANPFNDFALASVLRGPFVGVSLDSIVMLRHRATSLAPASEKMSLFDALKGFEPPVEGDVALIEQFRSWFVPLSEYGDRLSAWEVISELFAKSPYLQNIARRRNGMQMLANVRKLLVLATQEPDLGPNDYAARIREIQQFRHKEGDAPASDEDADEVTIMTIHKSKGLEFEIVVLPDTYQKLSHSMADVEIDPWLPMVTVRFDKAASMYHEWLASRRQERETEEEWRVMYVAMTRAKTKLCICLDPGGFGEKLATKISRLIGFKEAPPEGVKVRP